MKEQVIHISSGRGPVECCLGVAMALREFLKEAAENKLATQVLETVPGPENRTLLSATVLVSGKDIQQFCEQWRGIALWICTSPYRKYHKRKNWFISVEYLERSADGAWNENEISFQTMRSGGPGGQNVNKVESAVRATHRSSGITVTVNESRSQLQNKKIAIQRLRSQFEQHRLKQIVDEQQSLWEQNNALERGNPSRIYEGIKFKRKL